MDDAELQKSIRVVQNYLKKNCKHNSKRRCLQNLGLAIREEIPMRKRDHALHLGIMILKVIVLGSFLTLLIISWFVLPKQEEDETEKQTKTRESLEKARKWAEIILMLGIAFYFIILFWPDTQGHDNSMFNFLRRDKYKSISVPNKIERLTIFIAGVLLLVVSLNTFKE